MRYEKNHLRDLYKWSLNGHSCWLDFLGIAHEEYNSSQVDFSSYGYTELTLFGKCLSIFENNGYEEVTRLINEVIKEVEQEVE